MSVHNIRLGSMLSFDSEQEKDIIEAIEQLSGSHKLGQFLSNIIRIAFENPELLSKENGRYEQGAVINQMDKLGMTYNRNKFMMAVTKEVSDMKCKIDTIYDKVMQMYTLSLMGKRLGLEDRSNNLLSSAFILEKQLKELQDTLGVTISDSVYASNKLESSHKRAEDTLEYIINAYDGIISEIRNSTVVNNTTYVNENTQVIPNNTYSEEKQAIVNSETLKGNIEEVKEETGSADDEIVDFGNADLEALGNFFGD